MKRTVGLIAVVVFLAGCGGSGKAAAPAAPTKPSATPSPSPSTTYGASASVLASSVKECSNVADVPRGAADAGTVSMANCTLLGKTVLFVTFRDAEAESSMPALFSSIGVEAYWASGTGYTASADSANGDAPGQKAAAEAVVAALGGTVEHFKP